MRAGLNRGTRIPIAIILGGLAEGLTPEEIIDHFAFSEQGNGNSKRIGEDVNRFPVKGG